MSFRRGGHARRQHQREAGAHSRLAGHLDLSAVLLHDLLDDGKPDSGARFARFFRLFGAIELLEDLLDFLLIHADALVLHRDPDVPVILPGGDRDLGLPGRVFHRVGK